MAQRDRVGIANPVALMLNRFLRSNDLSMELVANQAVSPG
jgi:hypothetical protein